MKKQETNKKELSIAGEIEKTSVENNSELLPETVVVQPVSIVSSKEEIVDRVKKAETTDELKELEEMFSVALTKNEIARMAKQDELLDLVIEQAGERIKKKPGELSTKDLIDYMNTLQGNLDKSHKNIKGTNDEPIGINPVQNIHNEVTVNMGTDLDRDSQNRVMDVVKAILQQAKTVETVQSEEVTDEKGTDEDD